MRDQSGEGEKPKSEQKDGSKRAESARMKGVETDPLMDDEIDAADFIDPEEFGYRRGRKLFGS